MGDNDRGARPRGGEEGPQADRGVLLHARGALLPGRRALPAAETAARLDVYAKSVKTLHATPRRSSAAAHRARRSALRGQEPAGAAGASPTGGRRRQARAGDGVFRRLRRHQGDPVFQRHPRSRRARHRLPDRRRPGQRRERALPRSAADRRDREYATRGLRISRRPPGVRSEAHRRDGDFSLGGYYAPRAASLEPRFACCIAWGAQWDYHATGSSGFDALDSGKVLSLSVPPEHLLWVFGVKSRDEALKKLEGFRLDGIVQKMSCPFLLLHGEGDEQIPLSLAQTASTRSAPSRRRSRSSPARKAATTTARSTT